MMKYPPRTTDYKYDICECGHYKFQHPLEGFTLRNTPRILLGMGSLRKPCEICMCPKFKYAKTEHNLFCDLKSLGQDYTVDEEKIGGKQ